jgi:hypothetical protein
VRTTGRRKRPLIADMAPTMIAHERIADDVDLNAHVAHH